MTDEAMEVRDASAGYAPQVDRPALPEGYKQTEDGVIPKGWELKQLCEIAQIRSGIAKNSAAQVQDPIRVHYLRVANVQDGYLDLSKMSQLTISRSDLERFSVQLGDVLMNEGGDRDKLGRGAVWRGQYQPCVHQNHVFVVRPKKVVDPEYLAFWSAGEGARKYFLIAGRQTTNLASINKTSLGQLPVLLPPAPEQRTIATALSDVDSLLESLDRLIAKKRDIKQAAMQQLLTGEARLPGFEGKWRVKRLGEVAEMDPENLGSSTHPAYAFNYIALEDVNIGNLESHSEITFSSAPSRAKRKLRYGDILVATVRPNLKAHLHFNRAGGEWVCSTGFCVIRCKQELLHPGYVFQHFFAHPINKQIEALIAGSNYPAISNKDVSELELTIPPFEEQVAISGVLSDMDAEIEALEQRRAKTVALKQALMQELLTGRTRLI